MKNLILFAIFAVVNLSLIAQEIPTKVLTPDLVNQNNPMTNGDSDLAKARRFVLFGAGTMPTTVRLFYTTEERVTSFKKTHSRLGISDGTNIAPIGTPILVYIPTGGLHYLHCLNQFSTFAPLQKEKVYIKGDVVYLPAKKEVTRERLYDVDPNRFAQTRTFYAQPQVVCSDAQAKAYMPTMSYYVYKTISYKDFVAQMDHLRYLYPNCIPFGKLKRRNDGVKLLYFAAGLLAGDVIENGKIDLYGLFDKRQITSVINPDPTTPDGFPNDFNPGTTPGGNGFTGGSAGSRRSNSAANKGMQQYFQKRGKGSYNGSYVQPVTFGSKSSFAKRRNN